MDECGPDRRHLRRVPLRGGRISLAFRPTASILKSCPCDPKKAPLDRLLRSIARILFACFACFYLSGAHLAILQVVAWGGMVVAYSAESGLKKGFQEVVSGKKPCCMCKALQKARQDESREGPKSGKTLPPDIEKLTKEMVCQGSRARLDCPCSGTRRDQPLSCLRPDGPWPSGPPVPPPRPAC